MAAHTVLGIVIPCYNEEEVIQLCAEKMLQLLDKYILSKRISDQSFIGFVDDRSNDNTWQILRGMAGSKRIKAIRLASNRGHQYALFAGLMEYCNLADCLVSLEADLQDDMEVISDMIERYEQGNQVVYGVRKRRMKDTSFKRISAQGFYRMLKFFDATVIYNHADFRLTSRKVNTALKDFPEVNLYLRGIFPLMGFDSAIVFYERKARMAGVTKYPVRKMISLALDGITSFSTVPLRIISIIGFFVFVFCVFLMGYALLAYIQHKTIPGWFSTVLPFYFLGGIQILCIGILGEYMGKIYKEVKRRPRYIIDERLP